MKIDISEKTYERLSKLVVGFDSPDAVINRLIDKTLNYAEKKPEVFFKPEDEVVFKRELLKSRKAEVCIYKSDGTYMIMLWNASKLQEESNLRANLGSGFLRDWKKKNIVKIELEVLSGGEDEQMLKLAHALDLRYIELIGLKPKIHKEDEYNYLIMFQDESNKNALLKIKMLNSDCEVMLPSYMLDD